MKILVLLGFLITVNISSILAQQTQSDSVTVTFEVVVPESTSDDATIFWAGSLNRWDPGDEGRGFGAKDFAKPATLQNRIRTLKLTAPKNSEETYKYTRGSTYSVEEQSDYTYKQQRSVVFDQNKTVRDTVEAWHDIPPAELQENWPKISLKKIDAKISYDGIQVEGMATILYDEVTGSRIYDFDKLNTKVREIPDNFFDAVHYYQRISDTADDLQLVSAAQTRPEGPWHVFVDQNDDKIINKSEKIFSISDKNEKHEWEGFVQYRKTIDNKTVIDSVKFTIRHATDLPAGYRSTAYSGAPQLTYQLPYKHRKGIYEGHEFFVTTPFQVTFRDFHQLTIDQNQNDTLEIGSGSNEVYAMDTGKMHRQQKYYLFPSFQLGDQFWEVANIDPRGDWIRLRPAKKYERRNEITVGKHAPEWEANTFDGGAISATSLQGKYVLLDFWGSWCGPCIEEIPLLKKAYHRFKSQNFEIVGFAYENRTSLDKALKKYRLPWPQVLDEKGTFSSKFLVRGYPTHYLIGPDGNILEMDKSLNEEKLIPTLEKYLK
jgi:peroxiredoxin